MGYLPAERNICKNIHQLHQLHQSHVVISEDSIMIIHQIFISVIESSSLIICAWQLKVVGGRERDSLTLALNNII